MADQKVLLFHIWIVQEVMKFIDILLIYFLLQKTKIGKEHKWLIEIKPYNQSVIPKATKRKSPMKLLNETLIVRRNLDKWKAAISFCKNKNWNFAIWTEKRN